MQFVKVPSVPNFGRKREREKEVYSSPKVRKISG